jgi:hypothetical protein
MQYNFRSLKKSYLKKQDYQVALFRFYAKTTSEIRIPAAIEKKQD